jgi:hypothetical protein
VLVMSLKKQKRSLVEVYYELSFNNLSLCVMRMIGIICVLKTLV